MYLQKVLTRSLPENTGRATSERVASYRAKASSAARLSVSIRAKEQVSARKGRGTLAASKEKSERNASRDHGR